MKPALRRPRCFLNVATSLDGKIASVAREYPTYSSSADRQMMDRIRARADAILIGAGTLRATDFPLRIRSAALRRQRKKAGRPEQPLNILLSASLRVPPRGRFFGAPDLNRLVVTTRSVPESRVRVFASRSEVLRLGRDRVDPRVLLRRLHARGIRELLLEGGGSMNFDFFRMGLVDEIFLTLCPVVIGGDSSPTPVDGIGFTPRTFPRFRLLKMSRRGAEVFLHYERAQRPGR